MLYTITWLREINMKLNEQEVFLLLGNRYESFLKTGGWSINDAPYDADAHNAVIHALREFVDSFSKGRLEVVVKEKSE